eukprot:gene20895-23728_t
MIQWDIESFDWDDLDLDNFEFEDLDEVACQDIYLPEYSEGKQNRQRKRKYSEETRLLLKEAHERNKLLRPRILRNDFRRQFANMCTNVFNSGDYRVVMAYINTYCASDVLVRHIDLRPCNKIGIPGQNIDITGQPLLAKYWYTAMTNCPDVVCYMHNAYVKVRSDGTASVKCDFELRGNAILVVNQGMTDSNDSLQSPVKSSGSEDLVASPEVSMLLERYARAKRILQNTHKSKRRRTQKHNLLPLVNASEATTVVGSTDLVDSQLTLQPLDKRILSPAQLSASVRHLLSTNDSPSSSTPDSFEVQMGPQGQLVITAATDVLCSYEIEFNAESKVTSVSVFCRK